MSGLTRKLRWEHILGVENGTYNYRVTKSKEGWPTSGGYHDHDWNRQRPSSICAWCNLAPYRCYDHGKLYPHELSVFEFMQCE